MLNLFLICLILVFIVDISGFVDTVKRWIWRWVFDGKKEYRDFDFRPWECSMCMSTWVGIIYILITGFSWGMLAYVMMLAFLTPVFKDALIFVKDLLIEIINELYYLFRL